MESETLKSIKTLILDIDGTLTDGQIYYGGVVKGATKGFNVKDGVGIWNMIDLDIEVLILTGRADMCNHMRFGTVGDFSAVKLYEQVKDKLAKAEELGIDLSTAAYIADDTQDIELLKAVAFSACPKDAHPDVRDICDFVSHYNGGQGAVREVCDRIYKVKNYELE